NVYLAWKQKITAHTFHSVVVVGSSAFVEQIFLRIGFMLYAIIVAKLGTTAYATHLICMTLLNMSFSFGDGISIAASALVGQNLGAKKIDLAKMYAQIGQRVAFLASTMLFFVFLLGRNTWISFFSTESEIIAMGANILIIMAFTTHIQTAQLVYNGCLRGAGDSRFVAIVALISVALVRPIITYVLCFVVEWGLYGAWISLLIDQLFRFLSAMKRFYGGKWSQIKL
ncbi:MAG: MATE family efflux transporter, partial [Eubacteriales bacterium]